MLNKRIYHVLDNEIDKVIDMMTLETKNIFIIYQISCKSIQMFSPSLKRHTKLYSILL